MESEKEVGMDEIENIEPEPEVADSTPATEPKELSETPVVDGEQAEAPAKTDAELALEETAGRPKEEMVPAAVVATQRAARRAAELEAAELRGRLAAQARPEVSEKSPIELAAEAESTAKGYAVSTDEVVIDGKLLKEQQAYDKRQIEAITHQQNLEDFKKAGDEALRTMTDEVHGEGLGLAALEEIGTHLLTDGDKLDIFQSGKNCGKTTRDMLITRIARAGGEVAKELKQRIKAHKDSQVKPKEKPGEPEPKVPGAEDEADSDAFLESVFEGL